MMIEIPKIYEEDIIELVQRDSHLIFRYRNDDDIYEIIFRYTYKFDFVEFDYISDLDWSFGLELQEHSKQIEDLVKDMSPEKLQIAFAGEYEKLQHYKLVIDDVGIYNVICKGMELRKGNTINNRNVLIESR